MSAPAPTVAESAVPRDRRRRPSGEPPPLVRHLPSSTRWYLGALVVTGALWIAMSTTAGLAEVTRVDLAVLRAVAKLRTPVLTHLFLATDHLGSASAIGGVIALTIVTLLAVRHFQHLVAYLVALLAASFLQVVVAVALGRPRPAGIAILGHWSGPADPSRPVSGLALVLAGIVFTLVPAGRLRSRAKILAFVLLGVLCAGRLYLAVDHLTDVFTGLTVGWALPVVLYRLGVPEEGFPVVYRRARRAHLDIGGARGQALRVALEQQLGLRLLFATPVGLASSAGSTPMRLTVQTSTGEESVVFAKLYATVHVRSDRLYKAARSMLYGRLEDETPFSSVRRLVEYEDHLLRLFRDAGLPTPRPYGIAELTPEREYVLVMEFVGGASELTGEPITDAQIDAGLRAVRGMWDAGLAHRDIKPSNVLVTEGSIRLIDLGFAAVRPSPWRQAVDLANMMLCLALAAGAPRVYDRALKQFAPDDIAEAFAASRGVTVPAGLRARLRADRRDLPGAFRALAPARRPVSIQRWTWRRLATAAALVSALALTAWGLSVYVSAAGLL